MGRFWIVVAMLGWIAMCNGEAVRAEESAGERSRVAFGETITVDQGQTAGDIVCAFCTVKIRGDVTGDMVTFFGTVDVGEGRAISGDVVTFGGGLNLANEARIGGDLVLFGGALDQASSVQIHGDRVVFAGEGWLLVMLLPLLLPIGVVWLIVWLFRRRRYRFPAYPAGRY